MILPDAGPPIDFFLMVDDGHGRRLATPEEQDRFIAHTLRVLALAHAHEDVMQGRTGEDPV